MTITVPPEPLEPLRTPPTRRRPPLLGIFALWTLWGLWSAQQNYLVAMVSGRPLPTWVGPFIIALVSAWFWAVLTPFLMWTTRQISDRARSRGARIGAHVVTFLAVHALDAAVYAGATAAFATTARPFTTLIFSLTTFNALTYGVIAVVTTALDYHDAFRERGLRSAQLEAQLALAQLQSLRAQLHPHFLFNALNAISALMHKDVQRADRMLARLSELLRLAIDTSASPEIRLIDEIAFVKKYLEIERMRFGERLDVRVDLPVETYDALVPNMLLQPLVENAVRHGVAPHAGPGRVEIRATRTGGRLGIVVSDTGPGMRLDPSPNGSAREGVGLRTTRARLEKLYGDAQELALVNIPGGGFETRVVLPFHEQDDPAAGDPLSRR